MLTTGEFWPGLAAPVLNGLALLLALGFRRNRAVMLLLIMSCAALALAGLASGAGGDRGIEAMRMFAPWLLLAIAAMPERRLLARRNLAVIGLLAIATWLTLAAPAHVWPGLRDAFPLGWVPLERGLVAAGIVLLAAAVCLSRWLFQRTAMEFAMGLVLIVVGIAQLPVMRADGASSLFCVAGLIALVAILHASYRMAFVDGLAGLPNRRALDESLARISGDYAVAITRAAEAGVEINLGYTIPLEGAIDWYDVMYIPADAPHPDNAYLFLDFMLRPDVVARASNYIGYANANLSATSLVDPTLTRDPAIYPDKDTMLRLEPSVVLPPKLERRRSRTWTKIKTGL